MVWESRKKRQGKRKEKKKEEMKERKEEETGFVEGYVLSNRLFFSVFWKKGIEKNVG